MFIHDAQDRITVGAYHATLDDFLLIEPSYRLPDGALFQLYVPGDKHLVNYGIYQRDEGASWTDGDAYLALESYYSTIQPDTTPDVHGFLDALVAIFGDYITLNSMYAGWPLFQQTLLEENWSATDDLLTDSYVNYQITTATYTAIVASAQAHYLPMRLQGRPGLMPLNILDVITLLAVLTPNSPQSDACAVAGDDIAYIQYGREFQGDTAVTGMSDSVNNVLPLEPVTPTDDLTVVADDTARAPVALMVSTDSARVTATEGVPVIV
jgi:hypothetical protein